MAWDKFKKSPNSWAGLLYRVYGTVPPHVTLKRGLIAWDAGLFLALVHLH